jgi:hypothetical protein
LLVILTIVFVSATAVGQPKKKADFTLAPAVAVEAEDFTIERGWKVIRNGHGNYMVDIVGFNHVSGERVLGIDEKDDSASAFLDVTLPEAGDYRLWVRYECPSFCEIRFRVQVEQNGRRAVDTVVGAKDNPKYWFGETKPRPQYDPPWGSEGLFEEVVTVPGLAAGKARVYLKGEKQPQIPGVTARRNIDLVYLTRDTGDAWLAHYHRQTNLYPILDAFRDSRGARWEVRFTNRGTAPSGYAIHYTYNRIPWGMNEPAVTLVKPGESSPWIGLARQDTTHFSYTSFTSTIKQPFDLDLRPAGGMVKRSDQGQSDYGYFLPPYPGKGDGVVTVPMKIALIRRLLEAAKAPGKKPTLPLTYGGWVPIGRDDAIGRAYAELYADLGFRSLHPAHGDPKIARKNLEAVGIPATKSWMVMSYRNPPTRANIDAAKKQLQASGLGEFLTWFDYGDEIGFGEWIGMMLADEVAAAKGKKADGPAILAAKWRDWLAKHRATVPAADYWRGSWGAFDAGKLRPDSSAGAASENPRLYVDSLIFYEESAIVFAAQGLKAVKAAFGDHVWCGANYSGHPFYFPTATMYINWFRGGAADMGRHSEYFWQVNQLGPMINGYFAEHFRAGMRDNPKAILRQYTMPHAPGNSDASFMRTAFSHLAHGAKMLDYFGIGMNDSWTENYVDHQFAIERYVAMRDVNHCIGFVEDVLPDSQVVPSPVALLVSESTERWDFAGIATDQAGHAHFGPDFRKTRTHHHVERLGIWKALTFLGASPDLIIENDLTPDRLKGYKMLVLVGDCLPPEKAPILEAWVKAGGTLFATAGAGQFDPYRRPIDAYSKLFGIQRQKIEKETFFRVRQELPYLKPTGELKVLDRETMPRVGVTETISADPKIENKAVITGPKGEVVEVARQLGAGWTDYLAAFPGVSLLWTAGQPAMIPDRSPSSHAVPANYDKGAMLAIASALTRAKVTNRIVSDRVTVDRRLIRTSKGYILALSNYQVKVGDPVTLTLPIDGDGWKATSAYHGVVPMRRERDYWMLTLPALGYGDMVRIER